jgi:hypothetical protein
MTVAGTVIEQRFSSTENTSNELPNDDANWKDLAQNEAPGIF